MIVLLYFCCFVLKYQSIKELLRAHVCHVDLYILLPTLNKIYLLTYLPTYNILMISDNVEFLPPICYAVFWQPFWKWQTSRKILKRRIAPLMVTYHYVKFDVSIIIHLEVININERNFNFPIGLYSNSHPLWTPQNMTLTPLPETYIYNSTKFHEILSSSSWDLPWTSSCATEIKKGGGGGGGE